MRSNKRERQAPVSVHNLAPWVSGCMALAISMAGGAQGCGASSPGGGRAPNAGQAEPDLVVPAPPMAKPQDAQTAGRTSLIRRSTAADRAKGEANAKTKANAKTTIDPKTAPNTTVVANREALAPSLVSVLLNVPLDAVSDRIHRAVPETMEKGWHAIGDDSGRKVELSYKARRERPRLSFKDGMLITTLQVSYQARFKARIRNPLPIGGKWIRLTEAADWGTDAEPQRVLLTASTRLDISDDWKFKSKTRLHDIAFSDPPPGKICIKKGIRLCVSKSSLAPAINQQIERTLRPHLQRACKEIDRRLPEQVRLRERVQQLWSAIQCPIALDKGARPACDCRKQQGPFLLLGPKALHTGDITGDRSRIRLAVGLTGRPRVVLGHCPPTVSRPLVRRQPLPPNPGLRLAVESELRFKELSKILQQNLGGKRFAAGDGKQVVIERVEIAGHQIENDRHLLVIRIRLGGATSAVVYIRGGLTYHADSGQLRLSDPDYTVETEDLFVAAMEIMNHEAFRRALGRYARFDLRQHLDRVRRHLRGMLSRKDTRGFTLEGSVNSLLPLDYTITQKAIVFRIAASGRLQASYTP